ncbi:MAG: hypothetical protein ABIH11_05510 [Candidatus Altiarchaeota archaeon]
MADKGNLDYRVVSVALAFLLLAVVGYHFQTIRSVEPVVVEKKVVEGEESDLQVFYLYPARCVDCDLNVPGQCDYCNSYYDERVMGLLSGELGVPVRFFVTDIVVRPNVFVASGDKAGLGDGRTKYNIANTVCELAGSEKSCELHESEVKRVKDCVARYGLADDTIVYHYTKSGCNSCARTTPVVQELLGLEYNETLKYTVHYVDHGDKEEMKLINECFMSFNYIDYVPQALCPANGKDLTGEFSLGMIRDFTDACIEAR